MRVRLGETCETLKRVKNDCRRRKRAPSFEKDPKCSLGRILEPFFGRSHMLERLEVRTEFPWSVFYSFLLCS